MRTQATPMPHTTRKSHMTNQISASRRSSITDLHSAQTHRSGDLTISWLYNGGLELEMDMLHYNIKRNHRFRLLNSTVERKKNTTRKTPFSSLHIVSTKQLIMGKQNVLPFCINSHLHFAHTYN